MEESTTPLATVRSTGLRYGLILALVGIILFLVFALASLDMTGPARWIGIPIGAVIIFLAHDYFKKNGDGYMSFGQGFGIAAWMAVISTVAQNLFTYIYVKAIDDSMLKMIADKQYEEMQKQGMSDEQIDQAMKFASFFMTPEFMFLVAGMLVGIIITLVIGLIVTLITQKKKPESAF